MKKLKYICLIIISLFVFLPLFQHITNLFKEPQLNGAFTTTEYQSFSFNGFQNHSYQQNTEAFLNDNFGFRSFFIKLKNSVEFLAFNKTSTDDIIVGNEGYLYSKSSIDLGRGKWYSGKKRNLKAIEELLKMKHALDSLNINLLVIIGPSKERVLSNFNPEFAFDTISKQTDFNDFIQGFTENNIPFIDFNNFFNSQKAEIINKSFTKTGFHWSYSGAAMALDSILKYMNSYEDTRFHYPKVISYKEQEKPKKDDADFERPLNLLFDLHQSQYYYPQYENQPLNNNVAPKVIVTGDSFFDQIRDLEILDEVWHPESKSWYYFSKSFQFSNQEEKKVSELDIKYEIEQSDWVILVTSNGTLEKFPYGLAEFYNNADDENARLELIISKTLVSDFDFTIINEHTRNTAKAIISNATTLNLKTENNEYLYADSMDDFLLKQSANINNAQLFTFFHFPDNKVAIRNENGQFLSANLGWDGRISATSKHVQSWELFEIKEIGDSFSLKAKNNAFFNAINNHFYKASKEKGYLFKSIPK